MKKFLLLLLFSVQFAWAGNINSVINEFKDEKRAEYVSIPWILMKIGHLFMDEKDKNDIAARVNSIRVLDLEECSTKVKERFARRILSMNKSGYETLMKVKDEEDNVQILFKAKDDVIKELVIVCGGNEDCALIQIKGNIRQEDIDELVRQETEGRNGRN